LNRHRAPVITPGERVPIARPRPRAGATDRVWALASGSGGVGRSTLAAVLGARLVRRGHTVCLVDADWTGPGLAPMVDVNDVARSPWSLPLEPLTTPGHSDLRVVPGPLPMDRDPTRADCRRLLETLRGLPDGRVVLDLPSGTSDPALDLWLAADVPMLVATPERLPLEATARLLARVFGRVVSPWLARRLGAAEARRVLAEAWERCGGRTGSWLRAVSRLSGLAAEQLEERAGRQTIHLALNRVRRGDDVDVGHALVTAARNGLGLDLRFRAVIPFEDDGWIRARRTASAAAGLQEDLLGAEVDDLLDRMEMDTDVPSRGDWRWSLTEAARAAGS
jgi:MinD-like ATPase involved in chromosome partitioning or flagellar assembly